jgi:hypothetical protein
VSASAGEEVKVHSGAAPKVHHHAPAETASSTVKRKRQRPDHLRNQMKNTFLEFSVSQPDFRVNQQISRRVVAAILKQKKESDCCF